MTHIELNKKFMKVFGLGNTDKLHIQSFTVSFNPDEYPILDVNYINIDNIIDDEFEKVLKSFTLKEIDDTIVVQH